MSEDSSHSLPPCEQKKWDDTEAATWARGRQKANKPREILLRGDLRNGMAKFFVHPSPQTPLRPDGISGIVLLGLGFASRH